MSETDHKQSNCPDVKKGVANSVTTKDKQAENGPCPACKGNHTYKPRNSSQEKDSSRLHSCKRFREELGVEDRVKVVLDCKGCTRCTSWTHTKDDCKGQMTCRDCGSANHSSLLHGSTNACVNQTMARPAKLAWPRYKSLPNPTKQSPLGEMKFCCSYRWSSSEVEVRGSSSSIMGPRLSSSGVTPLSDLD